MGGRALELIGSPEQLIELFAQASLVAPPRCLHLVDQPVELDEFRSDGRDQLADAFARAQRGRLAQFVFRSLEQCFDRFFAAAARFVQCRAQRRALGARGEPCDRRPDRRTEEKE